MNKNYENYEYYNYDRSDDEDKQKKYKRYTIKEKLDIIARAEIVGNRKAALEYNLDESSVRYLWIHKNEYLNTKNKN